ncbi:hypothetical protein [Amycolatopsis sp. FDAARGOS 1241]|uniref:hypothetical protein n=1 Tax=Amycolatopsis sp. FDAARGOS 1241 TaxID=2778070 RepID=UPI0019516E09|nr:hypothetical protein [Amycolatopsis sp. FDAARGOS 1241]QRP47416.1 hypothetical protein I6J71_05460 [Amycolatopsis sp. FDAARGOS 1241]
MRRSREADNRKRIDPSLSGGAQLGRCLGCRRRTHKNTNLCGRPACSRAVAGVMEV